MCWGKNKQTHCKHIFYFVYVIDFRCSGVIQTHCRNVTCTVLENKFTVEDVITSMAVCHCEEGCCKIQVLLVYPAVIWACPPWRGALCHHQEDWKLFQGFSMDAICRASPKVLWGWGVTNTNLCVIVHLHVIVGLCCLKVYYISCISKRKQKSTYFFFLPEGQGTVVPAFVILTPSSQQKPTQ